MRLDKATTDLPACGAHGRGGLPGLVELAVVLTGTIARVAEDHDLTPTQGRLLCGLAGQPRRMVDLAQSLGIEKAALTGLVDRAERRGLVERATVPGDRRAVHVTLTDDGSRAMLAFETGVASALDELLAPLPAKDRSAFRRIASAVAGAARAA